MLVVELRFRGFRLLGSSGSLRVLMLETAVEEVVVEGMVKFPTPDSESGKRLACSARERYCVVVAVGLVEIELAMTISAAFEPPAPGAAAANLAAKSTACVRERFRCAARFACVSWARAWLASRW